MYTLTVIINLILFFVLTVGKSLFLSCRLSNVLCVAYLMFYGLLFQAVAILHARPISKSFLGHFHLPSFVLMVSFWGSVSKSKDSL